MKLKDGFEILNICDDTVAIYTVGDTVDLRNTIVLNSVAELLFRLLQNEISEEKLVQALVSSYDIAEEKAKQDLAVFLQNLDEKGLLEK